MIKGERWGLFGEIREGKKGEREDRAREGEKERIEENARERERKKETWRKKSTKN